MAAMVNMNSLLNGKDSRWLQLEVCREFQRNKCSRQDTECKFAHPPANVEVQNGKVTACYDSIKGRCNRDKPPCKYFHPPQHLKDQLLINGRNHLALKNALMQQMGIGPGQPVIPGQVPAVASNPYLTSIPANTYSPYFAPGHLVPALLGPDPSAVSQLGPVVPQAVQVAQQKIPRSDRLEAFSGMVPYKRPAAEKSGIPVYQPGATTYQQLMQLQQPPFVPVSCEYQPQNPTTTSTTTTTATSSAATASPQPQTSITTTTSTTSATTLANMTNIYAANNNLQLNFTQSPNYSTALISQSHFTNNLVESSGNNTKATTSKTIAVCNNNASNVNSYNKNNSLYNFINNNTRNNSNNNNNILSFVNNNNNSLSDTNTCSQNSPTTPPTQLSKNPFATAINIHGTSTNNNKSNDLLNDTSDIANGDSTNSNTAANGIVSTSTECTSTNNNTASSVNNPIGNSATPTVISSEACSPQTLRYQNDSDTETNAPQDNTDYGDILTQQHQHILQHDFTSKSKTSASLTNPFNGSAITTISEVPLPTAELSIVSSTGVGILPTPISATVSAHLIVPTSTSVVSNTYQTQQNMQRFYNAHSFYQSGVGSYANVLVSHAGYTPSTNTITSNHYTSQAITVPSPYGTVVTAAGTPAYSYASAPQHYVNSTAVANPVASYYHDAASLAKEVAQKNYANAVKMAAASNVFPGKPLTAANTLNYTGMALNKPFMPAPAQATAAAAHAAMAMAATSPHHHTALIQAQHQQAQVQAQHVQAAQQQAAQAHAAAAAAAQMRSIGSLPNSGMSTPVGTPVHTPSATPSLLQRPGTGYIQSPATTMLRPQPIQLATVAPPGSAANSFAAVAQAAASQQYVAMQQQQGFFYPGIMSTAGYPFAAMSSMQAIQSLPTMTQMTAQAPPATAGSTVVLNPYKKMKTS